MKDKRKEEKKKNKDETSEKDTNYAMMMLYRMIHKKRNSEFKGTLRFVERCNGGF